MPRTAIRRPADTGTKTRKTTTPAPAKRGPGRPPKVAEPVVEEVEESTPVRRGRRPAAKAPEPVATPARRGRKPAAPVVEEVEEEIGSWGDVSDLTGYREGTDLHVAAEELIKGGFDRQEIIDRVRGLVPETTRNGTPKMVPNLVSQAIKTLLDSGKYEIESHYQLVAVPPPAPKPTKRGRTAR